MASVVDRWHAANKLKKTWTKTAHCTLTRIHLGFAPISTYTTVHFGMSIGPIIGINLWWLNDSHLQVANNLAATSCDALAPCSCSCSFG